MNSSLEEYEQAIASYNKALHFKSDYHQAWNNRGNALQNLGRYEQAITESGVGSTIASYDKALEINPDKEDAWYNKACYYARQNQTELAIENLQKAINSDSKYKEMAKTDSYFDNIRHHPRFQELLA